MTTTNELFVKELILRFRDQDRTPDVIDQIIIASRRDLVIICRLLLPKPILDLIFNEYLRLSRPYHYQLQKFKWNRRRLSTCRLFPRIVTFAWCPRCRRRQDQSAFRLINPHTSAIFRTCFLCHGFYDLFHTSQLSISHWEDRLFKFI